MLHGEIKVNDTVIGAWSAVRQSYLAGVDHDHDYKCRLVLNNQYYEGVVSHRYSDGAAVLVSKIMELKND